MKQRNILYLRLYSLKRQNQMETKRNSFSIRGTYHFIETRNTDQKYQGLESFACPTMYMKVVADRLTTFKTVAKLIVTHQCYYYQISLSFIFRLTKLEMLCETSGPEEAIPCSANPFRLATIMLSRTEISVLLLTASS